MNIRLATDVAPKLLSNLPEPPILPSTDNCVSTSAMKKGRKRPFKNQLTS